MMNKTEKNEPRKRIQHPIPPLYSADSKILILGSFPSVKSRETAFFYGHPQNRFWKLLSLLLEAPFPETIAERRKFLLAHGIAVWDVIASCEIYGSSDASIHNAVPNDLRQILDGARIRQIYVNGRTAGKLYRKYQEKPLREVYGDCAEAVILPSTSPANAAPIIKPSQPSDMDTPPAKAASMDLIKAKEEPTKTGLFRFVSKI